MSEAKPTQTKRWRLGFSHTLSRFGLFRSCWKRKKKDAAISNPMTVFDESIQRMDRLEEEIAALGEEITELEETITDLRNESMEE